MAFMLEKKRTTELLTVLHGKLFCVALLDSVAEIGQLTSALFCFTLVLAALF